MTTRTSPSPFDVAFAIDLAHGACVAVHLPPPDTIVHAMSIDALAPEERAFADGIAPRRRIGWIGGRIALRAAADRAGVASSGAVLVTPRGAPLLAPGVAASISHKNTIALALAAPNDGAAIGIDVEIDARQRVDVSARILRDEELAEIAALEGEARTAEVLLRFSAKESIYKAIDPFVGRYVAFKEARVTPRSDGTTLAELHLSNDEGPFDIDVRWLRRDGLVITSARARRA